jgi:hypothetical protein
VLFRSPYFTVSDLRLPISSPLTTRRVTVEVFDPASTRLTRIAQLITPRHGPHRKHRFQHFYCWVTQLSHGPRKEHLFTVSRLVSVRNLLPSRGRRLQSHYLGTYLHATICRALYLDVSVRLRMEAKCFLSFNWLQGVTS